MLYAGRSRAYRRPGHRLLRAEVALEGRIVVSLQLPGRPGQLAEARGVGAGARPGGRSTSRRRRGGGSGRPRPPCRGAGDLQQHLHGEPMRWLQRMRRGLDPEQALLEDAVPAATPAPRSGSETLQGTASAGDVARADKVPDDPRRPGRERRRRVLLDLVPGRHREPRRSGPLPFEARIAAHRREESRPFRGRGSTTVVPDSTGFGGAGWGGRGAPPGMRRART